MEKLEVDNLLFGTHSHITSIYYQCANLFLADNIVLKTEILIVIQRGFVSYKAALPLKLVYLKLIRHLQQKQILYQFLEDLTEFPIQLFPEEKNNTIILRTIFLSVA